MLFCNPAPGEDEECVTSPYIYLRDISREACGDTEKMGWNPFLFFGFFFKPQGKSTRVFIWENFQKMNSESQPQV